MSYLEPTGWIQTYTGKKFFPMRPTLDTICIEDIAHSLSMLCRFTGHSQSFYSVAQHSVLVSNMCSEENKFFGLMHDAEEAYTNDLARPIKRLKEFEFFRKAGENIHKVIREKFELPTEEPEEVKLVDTKMLATEARDLMSPLHQDWKQYSEPYDFVIIPLQPKEAKELFMERFNMLYKGNSNV